MVWRTMQHRSHWFARLGVPDTRRACISAGDDAASVGREVHVSDKLIHRQAVAQRTRSGVSDLRRSLPGHNKRAGIRTEGGIPDRVSVGIKVWLRGLHAYIPKARRPVHRSRGELL